MKNFFKPIILIALLINTAEVAGQASTPPIPANEGNNNQSNSNRKKKETKEDKDKDKTKENNLPPNNIFGSDDSRKQRHHKKK
ncbi:MAG TPA: hypothetical protein VNB90_10595 [Cytophagaceae bacterium]|jgi:hypothetical protein|nr:hypothetical protein [Cytophagaceae bacterium]